jgi:hypothetical protein
VTSREREVVAAALAWQEAREALEESRADSSFITRRGAWTATERALEITVNRYREQEQP